MTAPANRRVVVLGMMAKMPVPGVLWQTLHYLVGLRQLGMDPYYVEAHGRTPSMLMRSPTDDGAGRAAALIKATLEPFGFGDRWAYQALETDGRCYGMSDGALHRVLREAAVVINLHGGTMPRPEFGERLVYLETDPVQLQIELRDGVASTLEFLRAHAAFFTFAENLGAPDCSLPVCDEFRFIPTRQPVVLDFWAPAGLPAGSRFTTIGNWRQGWRTVQLDGETYTWSKDEQWQRFLDLPARTGQRFELALSGHEPRHREHLEARGWAVRNALDFGADMAAYRDFIAGSHGEFTVAKDQNIRFRTGWFSDRSATYLAAARPVVTQDTGFGCALPTGAGLFAVSDLDEAVAAIEDIAADLPRHQRAAAAIAAEHFDARHVLRDLLAELDIAPAKEPRMTPPDNVTSTDPAKPARHVLSPASRVLALIPHFECEEWLADALDSLLRQTRPPDGIVVIDDASERPPIEIVERHPGVTLLHADRNVGPYRLVQQVIEDTEYDAYLFQDADDWSAPDRLERLLEAGQKTGAELLGTQEMRVFCQEPEVAPIRWPLDVKAQFVEKPTAFPLLHPTSIVTRDLVMALGGFASGLRFSGDAEFLRRAQYVAHVTNIPHYGYFRRIRQGSLTTAKATGLQSPERQRVMEMLWARARRNADLVAAGEQPDLTPCATQPPVGLRLLAGPPLHAAGQAAPPAVERSAPPARQRRGGPPRPVFVLGADRSGASALAWALGQHPELPAVMDTAWVTDLAATLPQVYDRSVAGLPDHRPEPISDRRFPRTFGRAAAALIGDALDRWVDYAPEHLGDVDALDKLFPEALFIHIVRDADAAIGSLVAPSLGSAAATGGTQIPEHLRLRLPEREAVDRWTRAALAGVDVERRYGARVLRVGYGELLEQPEAVIRRCLQFAGEDFDDRCLRPLRGMGGGIVDPEAQPAVTPADRAAHPAAWAAARAISDELTGASGAAAGGGRGSRTRMSALDVERLNEKARGAAHELLTRLVPEGATVLVASRGDEEILRIPGRTGWHFPAEGRRPESSDHALVELAALQGAGAGYLYFPSSALWWLEHLPELRSHLERRHVAIAGDEAAGVLFELSDNAEDAPRPAAAGGGAQDAVIVGQPRIVMVTDHFPKFSETFFMAKFLGLRRNGWDVHVVCNRSNKEQWEFFDGLREDGDVSARLHPTKDFETTIAELEPDLIHFGYGTLALGRMHAAQATGAKTVVSFRGYDINYHGLEDPAIYDEVWHGVDMLHFVGEDTWERAQRRGCPPQRAHTIITDAVDVSRFSPPERSLELAGTAERPLRIVSVGRLHWKKGHEFGLAAIRKLVDRGVDVRYRIIGEGPHREATLFAIHDLQLAGHVELCGAQPAEEVHAQLAWADVFLHPAVSEGFCVSAIEAQAMGLPVVCSDADGLAQNVVDGETGFVVARRDAALLADRLATLAQDAELRLRLGAAARRRATVAFDETQQIERFEALYRQLLAQPAVADTADTMRRETLDAMTGELAALEARATSLRRRVFAQQVVARVKDVAAELPAGATVLVVSRGDEALVDLHGRRAWHFPQAPGGEYAGHHPADGREAVEHLEDLRARGADHLIVPATSQWWLDHYTEFAEHLARRYARVSELADGYVVFSLSPVDAPQPATAP
ncbi:MAG TPA: glycosyltransferase [Baekduia sp.]|nr:glycosyltransferase [Baekduia sp.]